jgi:hypothetical protein
VVFTSSIGTPIESRNLNRHFVGLLDSEGRPCGVLAGAPPGTRTANPRIKRHDQAIVWADASWATMVMRVVVAGACTAWLLSPLLSTERTFVSTRSGLARGLRCSLYRLLTVLVLVDRAQ